MEERLEHEFDAGTISGDIHELISYRPSWLVRNGSVLFLLLLAIFFSFAWFIHYPDVIRGSIKLVSVNSPKLLIAKSGGRLTKLLVVNEQIIKRNQPLAFLQSTADHEQVLALRKWISLVEPFIDKDSCDVIQTYLLPPVNQLGEIQQEFQNFQNILKETIQVLGNGYYQQRRLGLLKEMNYLSVIQNNTKEQNKLLKRDYALQEIEYKANEQLVKDSVIARLELNQSESKLIGKQKSLEQMTAQLTDNLLNEQSKRKEILDVEKYIVDQKQKFQSEFFSLKSKVEAWLQLYVVFAPEDGKISFTSFLQDDQMLSAGDELFYVEPIQSRYYGQLLVSQAGMGKIKVGQKVILRVKSYPSNEFGFIEGAIGHISDVPTSSGTFLIRVDLPNGLHTNLKKNICFRNSLIADAEVVTDKRRLLDRFLGQLRDLVVRQ